MRRWLLALIIGIGLAVGGTLIAGTSARADGADGTFQMAMSGQVASSKVQSTDKQGNATILATLDLQTTSGYYPAVMLQLDVTEQVSAKGVGTLTGQAQLGDLQQRQTIFTATVHGTITTPTVGQTQVTYTLQAPHAATGQGGTLTWSGIWLANRQGALNATAKGIWRFPTGVPHTIAVAIWPDAVTAAATQADPTLWYLTRGAASAAYVVLIATTLLGMGISTQAFDSITRRWRVLDLHQVLTLLMLGLIALHLITLAFDPFLTFGLTNLIWPINEPYRAVPTALGVLALYALLVVTISSWVRRWLSYGFWRLLHYLSIVAFILLTLHGILSGTDSGTSWMITTYVTGGVAVGALGALRVAQAVARSRHRSQRAPSVLTRR